LAAATNTLLFAPQEGLAVPVFDISIPNRCSPQEWFSFMVNEEGMFLFIFPVQFCLVWPWTEL
jgi:hypothetical protein